MRVVEDGNLPSTVYHKEETIGLVESHHLYAGVCFEVHRAGETGNVQVAKLVHHGEQVEESFPGGVEDHGADYCSYECC